MGLEHFLITGDNSVTYYISTAVNIFDKLYSTLWVSIFQQINTTRASISDPQIRFLHSYYFLNPIQELGLAKGKKHNVTLHPSRFSGLRFLDYNILFPNVFYKLLCVYGYHLFFIYLPTFIYVFWFFGFIVLGFISLERSRIVFLCTLLLFTFFLIFFNLWWVYYVNETLGKYLFVTQSIGSRNGVFTASQNRNLLQVSLDILNTTFKLNHIYNEPLSNIKLTRNNIQDNFQFTQTQNSKLKHIKKNCKAYKNHTNFLNSGVGVKYVSPLPTLNTKFVGVAYKHSFGLNPHTAFIDYFSGRFENNELFLKTQTHRWWRKSKKFSYIFWDKNPKNLLVDGFTVERYRALYESQSIRDRVNAVLFIVMSLKGNYNFFNYTNLSVFIALFAGSTLTTILACFGVNSKVVKHRNNHWKLFKHKFLLNKFLKYKKNYLNIRIYRKFGGIGLVEHTSAETPFFTKKLQHPDETKKKNTVIFWYKQLQKAVYTRVPTTTIWATILIGALAFPTNYPQVQVIAPTLLLLCGFLYSTPLNLLKITSSCKAYKNNFVLEIAKLTEKLNFDGGVGIFFVRQFFFISNSMQQNYKYRRVDARLVLSILISFALTAFLFFFVLVLYKKLNPDSMFFIKQLYNQKYPIIFCWFLLTLTYFFLYTAFTGTRWEVFRKHLSYLYGFVNFLLITMFFMFIAYYCLEIWYSKSELFIYYNVLIYRIPTYTCTHVIFGYLFLVAFRQMYVHSVFEIIYTKNARILLMLLSCFVNFMLFASIAQFSFCYFWGNKLAALAAPYVAISMFYFFFWIPRLLNFDYIDSKLRYLHNKFWACNSCFSLVTCFICTFAILIILDFNVCWSVGVLPLPSKPITGGFVLILWGWSFLRLWRLLWNSKSINFFLYWSLVIMPLIVSITFNLKMFFIFNTSDFLYLFLCFFEIVSLFICLVKNLKTKLTAGGNSATFINSLRIYFYNYIALLYSVLLLLVFLKINLSGQSFICIYVCVFIQCWLTGLLVIAITTSTRSGSLKDLHGVLTNLRFAQKVFNLFILLFFILLLVFLFFFIVV